LTAIKSTIEQMWSNVSYMLNSISSRELYYLLLENRRREHRWRLRR